MSTDAPAKPQKEHEILEQFVGDWTFEGESNMGPDGPSTTFNGTETGRTLGGRWALLEGQSEDPVTGSMRNLITLGYDVAKKKYVGSFVGSEMSFMWLYEGEMDPSGTKLVMGSSGPSFDDPSKTSRYRDTFEIIDENTRRLTGSYQTDSGEWTQFMTITYRRTR